jgi:hypothetical protein
MLCPECKRDASGFVIDSRPTRSNAIRRRRRCECGFRFTTYEMIAEEIDDLRQQVAQAEETAEAAIRFAATRSKGIDLCSSSLAAAEKKSSSETTCGCGSKRSAETASASPSTPPAPSESSDPSFKADLTPRQRETLEAIRRSPLVHDVTFRELMAELRVTSPNAICVLLRPLERKGYISRREGRHGITILNPCEAGHESHE